MAKDDVVLKTLYRDNEVDGFRMGAMFDLRVRMAFEILQRGDLTAFTNGVSRSSTAEERGREIAAAVLATTSELVKLAEVEGLVTPFPESGISTTLKRQVKRVTAFQVEQQVEGQRAQGEMGGRIATPSGVVSPILPPSGGSGQPN